MGILYSGIDGIFSKILIQTHVILIANVNCKVYIWLFVIVNLNIFKFWQKSKYI